MLNDVQGPETCNTYNMLRLTKMLYQNSGDVDNSNKPDPRYVDYYERALYNHILSSQEPDKGGFVYFTPMRPGHYRVYSQPETSMWCCVGSGLEIIPSMVNLFMRINKIRFTSIFYSFTTELERTRRYINAGNSLPR